MQPKWPPPTAEKAKLAALPLAALMALLDRDQLKVASENTAIAAVTHWLEQEGRREALEREQKRELAKRLRLPHSTHWYLTSCLMDEEHWLWEGLSTKEAVLLLGCAHQTTVWDNWKTDKFTGPQLDKKLDHTVSWSQEGPRPPSTVTQAELELAVSLRELWDKKPRLTAGVPCFFSGLQWTLEAWLPGPADDQGAVHAHAFAVAICHSPFGGPTQHSYEIEAVPAANGAPVPIPAKVVSQAEGTKLMSARGTGTFDAFKCTFTSLSDARNKLNAYIHADGHLHLRSRVFGVQ